MHADFVVLVQDILPEATWQFAASTVGALLMRKDHNEYLHLKRSAGIADQVMQRVWSRTTVGMPESDVMANIKEALAERGANALFHIVSAGKNSTFTHHQTSETLLKQDDGYGEYFVHRLSQVFGSEMH